jgi:hypothetical protein
MIDRWKRLFGINGYYIAEDIIHTHDKQSYIYLIKVLEKKKDEFVNIKLKTDKHFFQKTTKFFLKKINKKKIKTFKELITYVRKCKEFNKDGLFYLKEKSVFAS